ncbi:DMT family transporter [Vibrio europaeus]|uniref:DMT family transporter n=2 Tax=Vibrio oreintalis group TaxID=1891919 RepID=A0AAE7DYD1_9VIBR|nr:MULTISPECIES: DMT family transporter [Vibrio oreintalis group]AIW16904.1 membrane protein [Vibrio tubiashii ATCC 19109]EIF04650.1 permease of the drug/metabolite transporter (DMT) superfamily protein [Vibrio tubiashii NCIMB 1337 = ATCC 19106]MCG9575806.1 DMT family transporter [Vibrio tubiashii]MDC5805739.1 DMT family transporter [Vibrio europaeus]MDC5812036.1 DMT family transporter [Vibrio europaeus]
MTTATGQLKKGSFKFPLTESLLLLVAVFWGTSYGLTKSALVYTSVLVFISIRFSITFLCMLPVVIRDFRRGLNKDWKIAIPTGFILSAIFFCEVFGVSQTSASNAAFLISLSVILTAFAELIINKKRVSNTLWGLTLCSVVGVLLLTSNQGIELSLNTGDYFILGAALLRALMVTLTKRFTEGKEITTSTLTSLQSLVVAGVAIFAAMAYLPASEFVIPTSTEFWITVAYLVLFCTLFAFYVQNYAVRRTSPTRVSLLMGSEPLFGAIFAMVWLQESLSLLQVVGGALILFSVIVTSTKES